MASNKKGGVLSKVPLPDTFFSIKHQLRPIASISVSAPSAILIYFLSILGFVGCWIFYSAAGPTVTYTVTQQEWQKEGYECVPLQNEPNYDVLYSYDECISNFQKPSTSTVTQASNNIWIYKPIKGSAKSLQVGKKGKSSGIDLGNNKCTGTNQSPVCAQSGGAGVECSAALSTPNQDACVTMFQDIMKAYKAESVCGIFKENSPYKCSKTEVSYKSNLEKLSLSVANTQLLFGLLTSFCVFIFYKLKKNVDIDPDAKKPWMEEIHRLEEELRRLRNDVDKSNKETV